MSEAISISMPLKRTRRLRRRALLVVGALIALWPVLAWLAARALVVEVEITHADALVVLGGSSTYAERTARAAELFKEGRAPQIILTNDAQRGGWSETQQRNPFFVERAAEALQRAGVSAEKITTLQQPVGSTHEEALLLRDYAAAHGLRSLLVVTSAYHSRRAWWTLGRVFRGSATEVGLAAVAPGRQTPAPGAWWLQAAGWRMVALEYPKLIYYWLCYR